jgi:predicted ATPase/DNA-binding CsgD family transcriptional regulator
VSDVGLVATTVVHALGVPDGGAGSVRETLVRALRDSDLLLVLDNFEHVVAAAPLVADLLATCPRLTVLVTSRVLLRVTGEHALPVPPLSLGGEGEAGSEAVRLFAERAQAVNPLFTLTEATAPLASEICQRLDGLPLAIELAAARASHLPLPALRDRLERRLPLLTGGPRNAPPRQQTMRDAIAWSHDLLSPDVQRLFRRLAVFAGGFTLEAAEAVCSESADDSRQTTAERDPVDRRLSTVDSLDSVLRGVAGLVEASLLRSEHDPDGTARYRLLETVREFGLEQLAASGEAEQIRERHAAWCLALAERTPTWSEPARTSVTSPLEAEHPNLRTVLSWLAGTGPRRADDLLRLVAALGWFWYFARHEREGLVWLERALETGPATPTHARFEALFWAGFLADKVGESRAALYAEQGLAVARALGDPSREAQALLGVGIMAEDRGDWEVAEEAFTASRLLFDGELSWVLSLVDYHLGVVALGRGNLARATVLLEAARAAAIGLGDDSVREWSIGYLVLLACELGDPPRAADLLRQITPRAWEHGWPNPRLRLLSSAAVLASAIGAAGATARLFGAATASDRDWVAGLPERTFYDRAEAAARQRLGEAAYAAAWETGRRLRPEEAKADLERVLDAAAGSPAAGGEGTALTSREREVLHLLVAGLPDREIADALFLSVRTVEAHVAHILAKFGVRSRTAAVAAAISSGLIEPGSSAPT